LRKIVLLRWGAGAVGTGCVPGGAVGNARSGVLRLSIRLYVHSGKLILAVMYLRRVGIDGRSHAAASLVV
jgi:hypothetical protein